MRFSTLAELSDGLLFSSLGIGIFLAVAGTLASAPTAPPGVPPADGSEIEAMVMSPIPVDISMFVPSQAEPEPEAEPGPEAAGEADAPEVPVVAPPRPAKHAERATVAPDPAAAEALAQSRKKKAIAKTVSRKKCTEAPDPLIRSTGPDRWTVRPGVVQRYTRDWSNLDQLGWSEPHDGPDGRGDGLQIGGIRCGSDVWDAGFRSGDVIHSVNGKAVKTIPQALLVYAAIHGADAFRVEITRAGARKILTYRLGDIE